MIPPVFSPLGLVGARQGSDDTLGADTVRKLAGLPPPPPGVLDPLRLADPSILENSLAEAGFKGVTIERLAVTFEFGSPAAFTGFRADVAAPFRALLEPQVPEMRQRILDAVIDAARAHAGADGRVRTTNETIVFAAHS